MRVPILPSTLLAALLLIGAQQVHDTLTHRPELLLEGGLPVVHDARDVRPETIQEPCRRQPEVGTEQRSGQGSEQFVDALLEIAALPLDRAAPPCSDDSEATLESWADGRFVWRSDQSLTLETW